MNHFKKEYYQSKIQKMIKLCMFVKKNDRNYFYNFLIFRENKLYKIKFREQIIHYTTSQNNYILPCITLVCNAPLVLK